MNWFRRRAVPTPEDQLALAREHAEAGRYDDALAIWEPLARDGHARACNAIGACFAEGLGVARDAALAQRWLTLAAEAGDPVGQRNLATLLFKGEGIEADHPRALALYRAASEQGDAVAQDMLSWMLLEDDAIPADPAEAGRWAWRAAAQGVASAMTRIGMLHHNALGVPRDPEAAAFWWRLAAARDDADGQAMLGAALVLGSGIARDPLQALAWLLRAERGGSPLAGRFLPAARGALDEAAQAEAARLAAQPLPEPGALPELPGMPA